eukprot:CAMPEP_0172161342 /NCGR_PEP_ID=MMETSP1050-20130122/6076_1 /TAXON_ID=233186 /ORGANISM="Cryptomonas curvata, Strain CCAP979/52" /LENGTH=235 /DNA_ID=CAMNT_0012831237 /DNA_START=118 /DNA_END=826 /DNA_ORIENTATION=+
MQSEIEKITQNLEIYTWGNCSAQVTATCQSFLPSTAAARNPKCPQEDMIETPCDCWKAAAAVGVADVYDVYTILNVNATSASSGTVPSVFLARSAPHSRRSPAAFAQQEAPRIPSCAPATVDTTETGSHALIANGATSMQMLPACSACLEVRQIPFAVYAMQDTTVTALYALCVSGAASMLPSPLGVLGEDIWIQLNADVMLGSMAMASLVQAANFVIATPRHLKFVTVAAGMTQ